MTSVTTSTNGPREAHRPLRADARRNVDKVLRAAEEVFATEGLAVPIDEIARRAGVGVGTDVYKRQGRHHSIGPSLSSLTSPQKIQKNAPARPSICGSW